jgi:hypothetical protein
MSEVIDPTKVDHDAVNRKVAEICGLLIVSNSVPSPPRKVFLREHPTCLFLMVSGDSAIWQPTRDLNQVRDYLWPAMKAIGWRPRLVPLGRDSGEIALVVFVRHDGSCRVPALLDVAFKDAAVAYCLSACITVYGPDWNEPEGPKPEGMLKKMMQLMRLHGVAAEQAYAVGDTVVMGYDVEEGFKRGWVEIADHGFLLTSKGRKALERCP